jgi:hypothetical protein
MTSNCSALANLHTSQFTIAHIKSCQFVFTSHCLVTDRNSVLFCSCRYWLATISHLTHRFKVQVSSSKPWLAIFSRWLSLYNLGTDLKENTSSNNSCNVARISVAKETCLLAITTQRPSYLAQLFQYFSCRITIYFQWCFWEHTNSV